MSYYQAKQTVTVVGNYVGYENSAYLFHLENGDVLDFDQINITVLKAFDLKSNEFRNKTFEITYSENFDDLDDEDIVIFKLEKLNIIE